MLPEQIYRSSRIIQQSSIMAICLFSCALYTTVTIAWFAIRLQKSSVNYWYILGLVTTIFWALLGVTPAELFLVFLPLSVSIGICIQTVWDRRFKNPSACRICVRGKGRHGKRFILPVRPTQHQYSYKPTLEPSHVDLEMNLKG
jgi:hypothetical protein